jgi:quercetin dioxygenase-like cupin family protein
MEKSTMNQEQPSNKRFMTPRSVNGSLSYQEDSVVSRELLHKSTGSVTLFAFDKNQGLSEHTTPYDALVMITDGQAEIIVSGVKHELKAGDLLLMPASSPHALKAIEPFKMVLIMMKS